jgi:leader peptidase (prepilin peptidase)/N-methyltransferase
MRAWIEAWNDVPWGMWAVVGGVLGAVVASFLGVVAERVPRHEGLGGRSHCACGRQLRWYENVPVIGWLACGGHTRCCRSSLPARYVLGEVGLGTTWALVAASAPGAWWALAGMVLSAGVLLWLSWQSDSA